MLTEGLSSTPTVRLDVTSGEYVVRYNQILLGRFPTLLLANARVERFVRQCWGSFSTYGT